MSIIEYRKVIEYRSDVPGAPEIRMECLQASMLPTALRQLDYDVCEIGEGERILATAIVQKLTLTSCGIFEEMTEGSTKAVAQVRHDAGIARVVRYSFTMM